ncbi:MULTISPECIES: DUF2155 domain-containing protein [Tabrizicola]|uniref:DUF2155 domain-containing protein n=1 Tax=Tabrizicola TaxID=1443919 RepID=UPI00108023ED|nr:MULTISPECIES: DUF2155 domain-containing protein [Paracoccaceae]
MIARLALIAGLLSTLPAAAQDFASAPGASLRFLDKLTSETGDVTLGVGQAARFGRLIVQLDDCRYPVSNPSSEAEAHLTMIDEATQAQLFSGWMLASSPALSALDHPRYDVWVLSCVLPEASPSGE